MITSSIWLLLFLLMSCQPDDPLLPPQEELTKCMEYYEGPLEVVWSTPIRQDTTVANSIYPVILGNTVLYNQLYFDRPNTIYGFDTSTGQKRFSFDDFPWEPDGGLIGFNNPSQEFDTKFYFNFGYHKTIFDVEEERITWSERFPYSSIRISAGKDHLYMVQHNEGGIIRDSEILAARKDQPDNWVSIYKRERTENEDQHFHTPTEWISPNGERIILFRNTRLPDAGVIRSNIIAYNVTQSKIQWEIEDINENGNGTIHMPLIKENLAFITNLNTISCIDIISGTEVWETSDLGTSFYNCAPVLTDDRLIVNGDNGVVAAIWLDGGSQSWRKNDSSHNPSKMAYYEGAIYYCTNDPLGNFMYALNANTGLEIYKATSPNENCRKNARLSWGLSIDENTGKLYTHDGYFAMCIQLEEY